MLLVLVNRRAINKNSVFEVEISVTLVRWRVDDIDGYSIATVHVNEFDSIWSRLRSSVRLR